MDTLNPDSVMHGMIVLVTVVSLTIGKTRGQLAIVPGAINVRIFSPIPLDPRTFIVLEQTGPPQVIPRQSQVQRISTDRLEPSDINSDLNLRPPTLKNRPNQRLFIPERSPASTSHPDLTKIDSTRANVEQINYPGKNQVDINQSSANNGGNRSNLVEKNDTSVTKPVMTYKPGDPVATVQNQPSIDTSRVNGSNEMSGTTGSGKPTSPTVVDKATGVEVTLDERASFDGDKCPTGYVRINGMCVEKD